MSGSVVCVGTGMMLAAHISAISKSHIEQADVVFSLMSSGVTEKWIESLNPNVQSLQPYYQEGKNRNTTYNEMVDTILAAAQAGQKVVAAFYGHPGIFACVAHRLINKANQENIPAHMEPGISAEDCLYADLAIDPGKLGCQHFETSQFMFYKRNLDTAAYLVLWQVGIAGDKSLSKYQTSPEHKQVLVDLLKTYYPNDHEVILYEAKVLPTDAMRQESVKLESLAEAKMSMHTTLVVPPCSKLEENFEVLTKLATIERNQQRAKANSGRTKPALTLVK